MINVFIAFLNNFIFHRFFLCMSSDRGYMLSSMSPSVHLKPALYCTAEHRVMKTTPHDSAGTTLFWHKRSPWNSNSVTPSGCTKRRLGELVSDKKLTISRKHYRQMHSFRKSWIGSHMHSIKWWHCWWPWVIPNYTKLSHFLHFALH